jgi:aspartate/methionine/tyrosine aminotransferase
MNEYHRLASTRMDAVQAPIIPIIGALIRQHPGTISFGQGVVSYPPPAEAIAQITAFLQRPNNHKYQSVQGIPPLLEAIAEKLQQDNQIVLGDQQAIVVTAGSNMGFLNAVLAITQPGDELILQTPYYFNHEMAATIAGCHAVCVPTDSHYQLDLAAIRAAITTKTRAIVTISPNNPTGVVYPEAALRAVNQLCCDLGLYHIHDEAYEYFTYEGVQPFSPGAIVGSEAHTISLYSLSKAYGFASWRIGYMVIPANLLEPVMKVQDTNLICPPVVSQYAALGALQAGKAYCVEQLGAIAQVRAQVLQALQTISQWCHVPASDGAFYFFLRVQTHLSAMHLAQQLIEHHQVAVIPGETFGMANGCYLRVAYAALPEHLVQPGIERLIQGIKALVAESGQ